jgi:hypothetical protein
MRQGMLVVDRGRGDNVTPKGIVAGAWPVDRILQHVAYTIEAESTFGLDDALWCVAYEPNCHKARQLIYRECGVKTKDELMDWDAAHDQSEKAAAVARALA